MSKKLTQPQKDLLGALSFNEWRTAPDLTAGNTITALQNRGIIKVRTPTDIRDRILAGESVSCPWRDYEMIRLREEP